MQPTENHAAPFEMAVTAPSALTIPLSRRETDVLRLMADGLTTKAIASHLGISFKTAACHRSHILQKLGVTSTVTAVRWAIHQGMIQP